MAPGIVAKKAGYKVGVATIKNDKVVDYQPFITGFMANEETYGRPVAMLELPDGSLLICDDYANGIYRVSYGELVYNKFVLKQICCFLPISCSVIDYSSFWFW